MRDFIDKQRDKERGWMKPKGALLDANRKQFNCIFTTDDAFEASPETIGALNIATLYPSLNFS